MDPKTAEQDSAIKAWKESKACLKNMNSTGTDDAGTAEI